MVYCGAFSVISTQDQKMSTSYTHTHATCQHAYTICQHAICTCNMPLCMHNMHVLNACALHSPHTVQKSKFMNEPTRGFPSIMHFWRSQKSLKLLRSQARLETNVRDRWENHSQAAKGLGVCCIRYQGCTDRFGSSQRLCAVTDWEKLCGYQWYVLPTIPGA